MKTVDEKQKGLQEYSTVGDTVTFRGRPVGNIVDEVHVVSLGYKHAIERIHQVPVGREVAGEFAYRFCYYAPSENGTKVFGQYGTLFPEAAVRELLKLAHEKGWPIFP